MFNKTLTRLPPWIVCVLPPSARFDTPPFSDALKKQTYPVHVRLVFVARLSFGGKKQINKHINNNNGLWDFSFGQFLNPVASRQDANLGRGVAAVLEHKQLSRCSLHGPTPPFASPGVNEWEEVAQRRPLRDHSGTPPSKVCLRRQQKFLNVVQKGLFVNVSFD